MMNKIAVVVAGLILAAASVQAQSPTDGAGVELINATVNLANGDAISASRVLARTDQMHPDVYRLEGDIKAVFFGMRVQAQGPATFQPASNRLEAVSVEFLGMTTAADVACKAGSAVIAFPDGGEITTAAVCMNGKPHSCEGDKLVQAAPAHRSTCL